MTGRDEKVAMVDGVPYRYSSEWINRLESEDHWRYYWHQQKLLEGMLDRDDRVLEVGVGSGFTANYLRGRGHQIVTVDIDADKRPDIVANLASWDFHAGASVLLGFEVFEHVPWPVFESAVARAVDAGVDRIFLSVPCCRYEILSVEWRSLLTRPLTFNLMYPRGRIHEGHHFWELGYGGITRQKLVGMMAAHGFRLEREMAFRTLAYFAFDRRERAPK
jgi:hypothetical protein